MPHSCASWVGSPRAPDRAMSARSPSPSSAARTAACTPGVAPRQTAMTAASRSADVSSPRPWRSSRRATWRSASATAAAMSAWGTSKAESVSPARVAQRKPRPLSASATSAIRPGPPSSNATTSRRLSASLSIGPSVRPTRQRRPGGSAALNRQRPDSRLDQLIARRRVGIGLKRHAHPHARPQAELGPGRGRGPPPRRRRRACPRPSPPAPPSSGSSSRARCPCCGATSRLAVGRRQQLAGRTRAARAPRPGPRPTAAGGRPCCRRRSRR